ncbi:MAG: hypothetical protein A3H98_11735 [Bacteroidetes bacterium RIFCSPLOWO2_02_FULL_36_8]|nr:MAG: hypothetical protein A3H98_11735 [Bacteroidetes bacterium RIFCSPLOWO2_02_FULL_36_8]OFY71546.1 MAG: hypothetical protein A3G23_04690 [Bacteroidetes bacterium RIFCSPLOWO2_12_FULL_37_12]
MTKEIRIYYECLEQAAHFIKPILEQTEAFKNKLIEIKLVKLTSNFSFYSKLVAPVVYLKDPDILITIIENETEYPLFQLEISTAVFTEDHELQRFDGMVAAIENNCVYGKLSPINKTSQSAHGGNTNFNYLTSYKAIYEKFGKLSFHFDWTCDENGNVIVNPNYLSCPEEVKHLVLFLRRLAEFVSIGKINFSNWIVPFENELAKEKYFREWIEKLNSFTLPDLKTQNTSRTEWRATEKELHLKINRFGHAMDPERGMLAYYGTVCDNTVSKMLFDKNNEAWYKDTSKETEIQKYLKLKGLKTASDYLQCFILGSGLHNNGKFLKLSKQYEKSKTNKLEIDLSQFLYKNFLSLNKALRTIFKFSKQFQIIDTNKEIRLKFIWKTFNTCNDFQKFPAITPIQNRTSYDEDDITYISVHNVLKQNGYKIIAVSYPGAQGDRVLLAEAGTGRRQQRRYIDIISYLPKSHSVLQENKGEFTHASIQSEISELGRYKSDKAYKLSIEKFVNRFDKNAPHIFKIGVGFWANSRFTVEHIQQLEIDKLDYFIFIKSDQTSWKVFCTGKTKLFSKMEGKVNLPKVYEVKQVVKGQMELFE